MADALGLGPSIPRCAGSSPVSRTNFITIFPYTKIGKNRLTQRNTLMRWTKTLAKNSL